MMLLASLVGLFVATGHSMQALCSPPDFHFLSETKTWLDAQAFCRQEFSDLATINNMDDMTRLVNSHGFNADAWIGLVRGDVWNWHWSLPEEPFIEAGMMPDYQNWAPNQPDNFYGNQHCVMMRTDSIRGWFDVDCDESRPFACYDGRPGAKNQHAIYPNGTDGYEMEWPEAQRFCRNHHTDLASIRNLTENQEVYRKGNGKALWIGLFTDPWSWSDQSNTSYRYWAPTEPSNLPSFRCSYVQASGHIWATSRCDTAKPFFCYGDKRHHPPPPVKLWKGVVRLQLSSEDHLDLSIPGIKTAIVEIVTQKLREMVTPEVKIALKWRVQP